MCAGGRGGYKFMWMSEGVYARGGGGVLHHIGMCEENAQMWVNEGE